jgi:glyoxylase-like metal-dependent hydrolase (beta-lactamase superfamily II)
VIVTTTAKELKAKLEAGEPVELVDIREADEFAGWHIHGSRNLPVYKELKANRDGSLVQGSEGLPKGRPIVTVCRGGIVSKKAALLLGNLGYDASSLEGGMREWGAVWSEARISPGGRRDATMIQIRRNGKGCLSYLLGADGEAVAIDPSIDVSAYRGAAEREGLRITHVLETHVHADHMSRARELCRATGARLVMPENKRVTYDYTPVRHGDKLLLGGLGVEVIATPGHTSESACYLVEEDLLFTGDTLFVDSVGRPDLEKGDAGADAGARMLHDSLHRRLLDRFEDVRFYPAHYGHPIGFDGSPIGSTLGDVRGGFDLLRAGEDEFAGKILASLKAKPGNFDSIIAINEGKSELDGRNVLELEAGPNSCAAG